MITNEQTLINILLILSVVFNIFTCIRCDKLYIKEGYEIEPTLYYICYSKINHSFLNLKAAYKRKRKGL